MLNKVAISILLFFIFFSVSINAEELKLNINLDIITYEFPDAKVVGDSFYYKINLTNTGNASVVDNFTVSIFNPQLKLIEQPQIYEKTINPNESVEIKAFGGRANETAVLPFDTYGDYKLVITSTKNIDFYRIIEYTKNGYIYRNYLRYPIEFSFSFDVMPKWQYDLWKETKNVNEKVLEANQKLINLTIDLENATEQIKNATYVMLFVAVMAFGIAFIDYYMRHHSKKSPEI
jgi:hypothetical protein